MAGRFADSAPVRARETPPAARKARLTSSTATAGGAIAIGATPLGAVALGLLAAGAFAVAAVALRHLFVGRRRLRTLVVDDLTVNRLIVRRPPRTLDESFAPKAHSEMKLALRADELLYSAACGSALASSALAGA